MDCRGIKEIMTFTSLASKVKRIQRGLLVLGSMRRASFRVRATWNGLRGERKSMSERER